ncbi:YlzJ-like family protein [Dendrosporobacter sp. 1207_IL3150]|uniref:YlzJ-like family protein n=1 Tax=Dendrosporobacter sp. 1207_IL3150 TaxID=3084054 RepID=UPI002FDB40C0
MILWTVMPLEAVFPPDDFSPNYEEVDYEGIRLIVEKTSNEQCRIIRLLSTNPHDFLRNEIQPGMVINFKQI